MYQLRNKMLLQKEKKGKGIKEARQDGKEKKRQEEEGGKEGKIKTM